MQERGATANMKNKGLIIPSLFFLEFFDRFHCFIWVLLTSLRSFVRRVLSLLLTAYFCASKTYAGGQGRDIEVESQDEKLVSAVVWLCMSGGGCRFTYCDSHQSTLG